MFERYTEKARRVIFFARYEASQYGSRQIETEHLLLGLLREDRALCSRFLRGRGGLQEIREEIEKQIQIGQRISTAVEIPLSVECKHILNRAAEEAERLGHQHVGTGHLLLGILTEQNCLAARVLCRGGLKLECLREEMARLGDETAHLVRAPEREGVESIISIAQFAAFWGTGEAEKFARMFAGEGQFVDINGNMWTGQERIEEAVAVIFSSPEWAASVAKIEDVQFVGSRVVIATLVWEGAGASENQNPGCVRMTVILMRREGEWTIARAQATGLQIQKRSATG